MAQSKQANPAIKPTRRPSNKPSKVPAHAKLPLTKRDRLRARLEQVGGASMTQLAQEFGWQPHTVRAAISGLRRAGLEVQRETGDASSVYSIVVSRAA